MLLALTSIKAWGTETTATINFNSSATKISSASVNGNDSQGNTWYVNTAGTSSFTSNTSYYQVGSSGSPATSITFGVKLPSSRNITSFSAKFGGFTDTAGTVTLKVGNTSVGTGALSTTNDVTISNTSSTGSDTLTVTVTGISKGVKCYFISYTYIDPTCTVAWYVNGAAYSTGSPTTNLTAGNKVSTLPTVPSPAGCFEGKTFVGWTNVADYEDSEDAPAVLFKTATASPLITQDTSFYAVFVNADSIGTEWGLVPDLESITNGQYVIVNSNFYLPNAKVTSSGPSKGGGMTITDGKIKSTVTDAMKWNFTVSGSAVTIKSLTGNYLYSISGTGTSIRVNTTPDTWTFELNDAAPAFAMKDATHDNYCATYGTGDTWRAYTTKNHSNYGDGGKIYLYKNTTIYEYSDYATVCCNEVAAINGSVSWDSGDAVLSWDLLANTDTAAWVVKYKLSPAGAYTSWNGTQTNYDSDDDAVNDRRTTTITGLAEGSTYDFKVIAAPKSGYCDKEEELSGNVVPTITTSVATIADLDYSVSSGPSTAQLFTVSGAGLTGALTVTAPDHFEVSKTSATTGFAGSVSLPADGTLSATNVWVRLASGKAVADYSGDITISGGSAAQKTVAVSGSVTSVSLSSIAIKTAPTKVKYLEGEILSAAGLVITATYSDASTRDIAFTGNEGAFTLSPAAGTVLSTSNTSVSITWNGKTTPSAQSINVYSVTVQMTDEDGTAIVSGPTASATGRTLTANENESLYKFKTWKYGTAAGTAIASASSLSTSLTGTPTGNVTIIAEYYKPITISWLKGGSTYSTGSPTTSVKRGTLWSALTPPTDPADDALGACENMFAGWSNSMATEWTNDGYDAPAVLLKNADFSGRSTEITEDITFRAVYVTRTVGTPYYGKVTSTADITNGDYLIVYETGSVIFNGGLSTLDAAGDTLHVTIADSKIAANSKTNAAKFTIDVTNKYVKSASGKYINQSSYDNGLSESTTLAAVYSMTISGSGDFVLQGTGNSSGTYVVLRYNSSSGQDRFRFYKNTQQAIQLYKYTTPISYSDYKTMCCSTPVSALSITSSASVALDATLSLTSTGGNGGAVSWSVVNGTGSATIAGSTLTPTAMGTVTVKAHQDLNGTTCEQDDEMVVTITASTINATGVSVSPTSKAIVVGESFTITPTVTPENTTDKTVSWTSSATTKATVSELGVVTGVAQGSSTVTCTTTDGGFTATTAVTVYDVAVSIEDEDGNSISAEGVTASASGRTLTASVGGSLYKFKQWTLTTASGTTLANASSLSTSLTGTVTGNVAVKAVFYKPRRITWSVNGDNWNTGHGTPTTAVQYGSKITALPTTPTAAACDDRKRFAGWRNAAIDGSTDTEPAGLFTTEQESPTITSDVTFYAVFADGVNKYELVKSSSTALADGDKILIVSAGTSGSAYALSKQNSNNRAQVAVTISAGSVIYEPTLAEKESDSYIYLLQLEANSTYFNIKDIVADKYLQASGGTSNNYLTLSATNTNDKTKFTISADNSGVASVVANITGKNTMRYNNANNIFSCYESGQSDIYIYRQVQPSGYVTSCASCDADATFNATPAVTAVTCTGATVTATEGLESIGLGEGCNIREYGFVWGTTSSPTTDSNTGKYTVSDVIETDEEFTCDITGLTAGTQYFVRTYAVNRHGTGYSEARSFYTNGVESIAITTAPTKVNYVAGETFDATGMVVTATMSDDAEEEVTGDITYSSAALEVGTNQDFAISYTLCDNEVNAAQKINVYSLSVSEGSNPDYGSYSVSGAVITVTPNTRKTYTFTTTNAELRDNCDGTHTIISPTGSVSVVINYVDAEQVKVYFKVNGEVVTDLTQDVYQSEAVTMPTASELADAMESQSMKLPDDDYPNFWGWSDTDFAAQTAEPAIVSGSPVINAEKIYYAVYTNMYKAEIVPGVDITNTSHPASEQTITKNGKDIKYHYVCKQTLYSEAYLQFKKDPTAFGYIYNSSAMSKILRIEIEKFNATSNVPVYAGSAANTISGSAITDEGTSDSKYIYNFPANTEYFIIKGDDNAAYKLKNITIYYSSVLVPEYMSQFCLQYAISGVSKSGTAVEGGTITTSHTSRCEGKAVMLSSSVSSNGYRFNHWTISNTTTSENVTAALLGADSTSLTPAAFSMPAHPIMVSVDVTTFRDTLIDRMHGKVVASPLPTGVLSVNSSDPKKGITYAAGEYTVPTLTNADEPEDDEEGCADTHYYFVGWVEKSSDNFNSNGTINGSPTVTTGGTTEYGATGKTYYAIWAEKQAYSLSDALAWCPDMSEVHYMVPAGDGGYVEEHSVIATDGSVTSYAAAYDGCEKVFSGWADAMVETLKQTTAEASMVSEDGALTDIDHDTTLYALFASENGNNNAGGKYMTDYSTTCEQAAAGTLYWEGVKDYTGATDDLIEKTAGSEMSGSTSIGSSLTLPTLTKDSTLTYWKATIEGTTLSREFAAGETFLVNHPVTLTAYWEPKATIGSATIDYTASATALAIAGWNGDSVIVETNGYPNSGWSIYGGNPASTGLTASNRRANRLLSVYVGTKSPGAGALLTVKNSSSTIVNQQYYTVPYQVTGSTTASSLSPAPTASSVIYVQDDATLTVDANMTAGSIWVSPSGKVVINSGKTLTVTKMYLRTLPWNSAELVNNGTLTVTNLYYTRIAYEETGGSPTTYPFAVPFTVDKDAVALTNNKYTTTTLKNHYVLYSYNGAARAERGASGLNWTQHQGGAEDISGKGGYLFYSDSKYYREFLFPVTYSNKTTSSGESASVTAHTGSAVTATNKAHAGWNMFSTPFTMSYRPSIDASAPILISELTEDNKTYWQHLVSSSLPLMPAHPYYYQALSVSGSLQFGSTFSFASGGGSAPAGERLLTTPADEPTSIQYVRLLVTDVADESLFDEVNLFFSSRFSRELDASHDYTKWIVEAERPQIYSIVEPLGNLTMAGLPDDIGNIPLGVYAGQEGVLRFSVDEQAGADSEGGYNPLMARVEHLYLVEDNETVLADLMSEDYYYTAQQGTTYRLSLMPTLSEDSNDEQGFNGGNGDNNAGTATGAEDISGDAGLQVNVTGKTIVISGVRAGDAIRLYSAEGRLLYSTGVKGAEKSSVTTDKGTIFAPVSSAGVYLLQVGEKVERIIVGE